MIVYLSSRCPSPPPPPPFRQTEPLSPRSWRVFGKPLWHSDRYHPSWRIQVPAGWRFSSDRSLISPNGTEVFPDWLQDLDGPARRREDSFNLEKILRVELPRIKRNQTTPSDPAVIRRVYAEAAAWLRRQQGGQQAGAREDSQPSHRQEEGPPKPTNGKGPGLGEPPSASVH